MALQVVVSADKWLKNMRQQAVGDAGTVILDLDLAGGGADLNFAAGRGVGDGVG